MSSESQKEAARNALRRLSDRFPTQEELDANLADIMSDNNDRGGALLVVSNVDNELKRAIGSRLRQKSDTTKEFLRYGGVCGSFDERIKTAYCLEIIGKRTKKILEDMRDVRNAFAHTSVSIGFESDIVSLFISHMEFAYKKPGLLMAGGAFTEPYPKNNKEKFHLSTQNIIIWLFHYTIEIERLRNEGAFDVSDHLPLP